MKMYACHFCGSFHRLPSYFIFYGILTKFGFVIIYDIWQSHQKCQENFRVEALCVLFNTLWGCFCCVRYTYVANARCTQVCFPRLSHTHTHAERHPATMVFWLVVNPYKFRFVMFHITDFFLASIFCCVHFTLFFIHTDNTSRFGRTKCFNHWRSYVQSCRFWVRTWRCYIESLWA